ncbi:ferritin family protein, partial [candidate division KSB1 bacterium]
LKMSQEKVNDLMISDYLVDVDPTPGMTYSDALIVAMKKEKNAFKLYMNLSDQAEDPNIKELFLSLAQEESKHKLRFEIEYDDYILREN